jgi:hypothetical protein
LIRAPIAWLAIAALALAAIPVVAHRELLSNDAFLLPLDSGLINLPRFELLARSLASGSLLAEWQPLVLGGTALHANPENPTLHPVVLALCSWFPPLLAQNLTILLHMALGGVGMLLFVASVARTAGVEHRTAIAGGLVAGLLFSLSYATRLDHLNFVLVGAAYAHAPWIFLAAHALAHGAAPRRAAGALGVLLGLQVFTGGLHAYAFTWLSLGLWGTWELFQADAATRVRVARHLPLALLVAGLLAAAKVLPALDWLGTTNRAQELAYGEARGRPLGGRDDFSWDEVLRWSSMRVGGLVPVALALLSLFARGRLARTSRIALLVCALAFLIALGPLHRALVLLPPFDRLRSGAERSWALVAFWLPVAGGIGWIQAERLVRGLRGRPLAFGAVTAALCAVLVPLLLRSDGWMLRTIDAPVSRDRVLRSFPNWREAATRAGDDWRAAYLEDSRIRMGCEQFLTTALGVEAVAGFIGYAWPVALEHHAFDHGEQVLDRRRRMRRLGILSTGILVEGRREWPYDLPEERSAVPRYLHHLDGAAVQPNPFARPRVTLPSLVIGVLGDRDQDLTYAVLDADPFPIRRASLVHLTGSPPSAEEVAAVDAWLLRGAAELPAGARGPVLETSVDGVDPERLSAFLEELLARAPARSRAGELERPSSTTTRARVPASERARFVVVSEPWATDGNWIARTRGDEVLQVRRADGAVSAVLLPAGEVELVARYENPRTRAGLLLAAVGLLLGLGAMVLPAGTAPAARKRAPRESSRAPAA